MITMFYAGLLALIMAVLSIRVPLRRAEMDVNWGTGGDAILDTRIRAFGNFIEYVPMVLLILWLLETAGGADHFLHLSGGVLVVSRLVHAIALTSGQMSKPQMLGRFTSTLGTWLVLAASGGYLVLLSAREIL